MTNNFIDLFTSKYNKEEFNAFYLEHTNAETFIQFNITKRQLAEIKKYWGLSDKPTVNNIIKQLNKTQFEEYYRTHSNDEVFNYYNINYNTLTSIRKAFNILPRTEEELKQINLRLYGVEYTGQREEVIKAIKETKCIEINDYKTIINSYSPEELATYFNTHSTNEICNYFNTNYDNIKKIRAKLGLSGKSQLEKEEINLRTYGVRNVFQLESIKKKIQQTTLNTYGVINIGQTQYQKDKSYQTKKANKSFNTSKPEDRYYEHLVSEYGEADVVRQYKDTRYPYACDFYIKSKDLFVELNLSWTHGGHKFDSSNPEDIKKSKLWEEKAKASKYYLNALNTWTHLDIQKFDCAEKNNLNYLVFYSEEELYK